MQKGKPHPPKAQWFEDIAANMLCPVEEDRFLAGKTRGIA
jgi:hypothetical protein